ncbi:MAG: PaaI family thioesterase [Desulforhopalus sp.]
MIVDREALKPIPNSAEQTCFGCGVKNHQGLQMEFFTDDKRLYSFLDIPVAMAGWDKTVHGGILSTILDEIMGWSVIYLFKKLGLTKSMTVNFIKPVWVNSRITVVGGAAQDPQGRTVAMVGEVYNEEDILCANATSEFAIIEPKLAVRLGVVGSEYMKMFEPILNFSFSEKNTGRT